MVSLAISGCGKDVERSAIPSTVAQQAQAGVIVQDGPVETGAGNCANPIRTNYKKIDRFSDVDADAGSYELTKFEAVGTATQAVGSPSAVSAISVVTGSTQADGTLAYREVCRDLNAMPLGSYEWSAIAPSAINAKTGAIQDEIVLAQRVYGPGVLDQAGAMRAPEKSLIREAAQGCASAKEVMQGAGCTAAEFYQIDSKTIGVLRTTVKSANGTQVQSQIFARYRLLGGIVPTPKKDQDSKKPSSGKHGHGTQAKGSQGTQAKGSQGTQAKGSQGTQAKGSQGTQAKGSQGNQGKTTTTTTTVNPGPFVPNPKAPSAPTKTSKTKTHGKTVTVQKTANGKHVKKAKVRAKAKSNANTGVEKAKSSAKVKETTPTSTVKAKAQAKAKSNANTGVKKAKASAKVKETTPTSTVKAKAQAKAKSNANTGVEKAKSSAKVKETTPTSTVKAKTEAKAKSNANTGVEKAKSSAKVKETTPTSTTTIKVDEKAKSNAQTGRAKRRSRRHAKNVTTVESSDGSSTVTTITKTTTKVRTKRK
jgi:hypothetical protein